MPTVAINREIFEFSCSQEETAKAVQQEFIDYLAPQLHALILKIVTEQFYHTRIQINKIEIDLGDVAPGEFSQPATLQKFTEDFTRQISSFQSQIINPDNLLPESSGNKISPISKKQGYYTPQNQSVISNKRAVESIREEQPTTLQQDWELIQTFLISGDLPWWADKKQPVNLEAKIRRIALQESRILQDFLKNQPDHSTVWQRLATLSKSTARILVNQLSPAESKMAVLHHKSWWPKADFNFSLFQFSQAQVDWLKTFFRQLRWQRPVAQKALLMQKVMALSNLNWVQQAALFDWLPEKEFKNTQAYFNRDKEPVSKSEKKQVQNALQLLTVYQLEFLLYPFSGESNLSTNPVADKAFTREANHTIAVKDEANFFKKQTGSEPKLNFGAIYLGNNPDIFSGNLRLDVKELKSDNSNLRWSPGNSLLLPNRNSIVIGAKPNSYHLHPGHQAKPGNSSRVITANKPSGPENKPEINLLLQDKELPGNTHLKSRLQYGSNEYELLSEEEEKRLTGEAIRKTKNFKNQSTEFLSEIQNNQTALNSSLIKKPNKQHHLIFKKLTLQNPALREWLQTLSRPEVNQLRQIVTNPAQPNQERRQLINSLLHHPAWLTCNLLGALANVAALGDIILDKNADTGIVPAKNLKKQQSTENRIITNLKTLQAQTEKVWQNLATKEKVVLQAVLQKATWQTPSEQQIIRRILTKLPPESLYFLQALIEFPAFNQQLLLLKPDNSPGNQVGLSVPGKGTKFYIENAGLCLLAPYLPGLFTHLQYLENKKFKNSYTAARALQVTQYVVTGKRHHPEYEIFFNKILCGFTPEDCPIAKVRLTKKEMKEADSLLEAVIQHWQALKNTTPAGFRQSFLQRKGILTEKETGWTLQVERQGLDMLLNTIPWGYTLIKLPWMPKMLQVEW